MFGEEKSVFIAGAITGIPDEEKCIYEVKMSLKSVNKIISKIYLLIYNLIKGKRWKKGTWWKSWLEKGEKTF